MTDIIWAIILVIAVVVVFTLFGRVLLPNRRVSGPRRRADLPGASVGEKDADQAAPAVDGAGDAGTGASE